MERRKAQRYSLSLPVSIHAPTERRFPSRNGKTCDISSCGVYFVVEDDPGEGAVLNLTITVPAELTGGSEVLIHLIGTAVRVEGRVDGGVEMFGVAATFDSYEMAQTR